MIWEMPTHIAQTVADHIGSLASILFADDQTKIQTDGDTKSVADFSKI